MFFQNTKVSRFKGTSLHSNAHSFTHAVLRRPFIEFSFVMALMLRGGDTVILKEVDTDAADRLLHVFSQQPLILLPPLSGVHVCTNQ